MTDEGSSLYEYLNYRWYSEATKKLKLCGITPPAVLARVSRMPAVVAQETAPNGDLVGLGDSDPMWPTSAIVGTWQQYASTQGALGPRPTKTFMIYDRGYLFSRKTWDPHTPEGSYLTLRFGQSRQHQVHGQDDATDVTFYALGKEQLWGNGVFGDDAFHGRRTYVQSRRAQNTVDIVGATYNRAVLTPLLWSSHTARYDAAAVSNRTCPVRRRCAPSSMRRTQDSSSSTTSSTQSRSRTIIQTLAAGRGPQDPGQHQAGVDIRDGFKRHPHVGRHRSEAACRQGSGEPDGPRLAQRQGPANARRPPWSRASVNAKHVRLTMVLVPSLGVHRTRPDQGHPGAHQRLRPPVRRRHGDRHLPRAHHGALGVGRQAVTAFLPDQTRRPSTIVRIAAMRLPVMPSVRSPIVSL